MTGKGALKREYQGVSLPLRIQTVPSMGVAQSIILVHGGQIFSLYYSDLLKPGLGP